MTVEFASGSDRIDGALYLPEAKVESARSVAGIVVIPDVRGLYSHYHDVARRIAAQGFAALALNLYAREGDPQLPDMPAVFRFMKALPDRRVLQDVQAAIDYLAGRPETRGRRIGLTGFCMGGKYALLAASCCRGLSAVVPWYGMLRAPELDQSNPEHALDAIARLSCPTLAFFGKEDPIVPLADVEELEARAERARLPLEVVVYPGAGHAFANDSRPDAYRPQAAEDAWRRAFAFFSQELG